MKSKFSFKGITVRMSHTFSKTINKLVIVTPNHSSIIQDNIEEISVLKNAIHSNIIEDKVSVLKKMETIGEIIKQNSGTIITSKNVDRIISIIDK